MPARGSDIAADELDYDDDAAHQHAGSQIAAKAGHQETGQQRSVERRGIQF